jgi:hypothetical protein
MNWKPLAERLVRTVTQPENAVLIELASAALLLAWLAHSALD